MFTDVDELARAEAEVTLARDQLRAIVDTVWEPLLVLDPDGRVVSANCPFYEEFQVTSEKVIGQLLFDLAGGRWNIADLRRQLDDVRTLGTEMRGLEVTIELVGRGRRIMMLNARRVQADRDGRQHVLLAFEEVTERREMEKALCVQRDELVTAGNRDESRHAGPRAGIRSADESGRADPWLTTHATPEAQQA